jgi:hypothetical protein
MLAAFRQGLGNAYWFAAGLALLTGVWALRYYRLTDGGLTYDEAFSWRMAQFSVPSLLQHVQADAHPPLYYLTLKAWLFFCGDSIIAIRSLSVVLSVMSAGIMYLLVSEASGGAGLSKPNGGAVLSVVLFALHAQQVICARNARMYSLAVLLAALTALALLRALTSAKRAGLWWAAYALATTAFAYTHYYAVFVIFAQAVWVGGMIITQICAKSAQRALALARGYALALLFAGILYVPWLGIAARQVHDVVEHFWIPPVTSAGITRLLFSWSTGLQHESMRESTIWLAGLAACLLVSVLRATLGMWFFLSQAIIPWVCAVLVSGLAGQSIVVERYSILSGFFLLAYWGTIWNQLRSFTARTVVACLLVLITATGLLGFFNRLPRTTPAYARLIEYLRDNAREGDVVLTNSSGELNLLRYYMSLARIQGVEVRCVAGYGPRTGHVVHLATLDFEDLSVGWHHDEWNRRSRVWCVSDLAQVVQNLSPAWEISTRVLFQGGGPSCTLLLLEKVDNSPLPPDRRPPARLHPHPATPAPAPKVKTSSASVGE